MAGKMSSNHNIQMRIKFGYNKKSQPQILPRQLKTNRNETLNEKQQNDQIEVKLEAKPLELDQFELSEVDLSYAEHSANQDLIGKTKPKQQPNNKHKLVDRIPDYVEIEAKGNGTAVFQVSWQYNLNTDAEESPFYLDTKVINSTSDHMNLNVCS